MASISWVWWSNAGSKMSTLDTIVAEATPRGRGGVAVLRLSGPKALMIAEQMTKQSLQRRHAHYAAFLSTTGERIDAGLALYFEAPHSFTGEHVVELQCHGGPVIVDLLLETALAYGARLARPGEFSERAFLNGKMDLVQAEAVADLIAATTRASAGAAMRSLQGEFSKQIHHLVKALIELRTFIEATLDFPDEDIEMIENEQITGKLQQIMQECVHLEATAQSGVLLQEGAQLVLVGPPNAGKSSLMNYLARDEVAIVSEIAGTTRDILKERVSLRGIPLYLLDTAGLRQSTDVIEKEGIRRTEKAMNQAECLLLLVDDTRREELTHLLREYEDLLGRCPTLIVFNKVDLSGAKAERIDDIALPKGITVPAVRVSLHTGVGLDLLEHLILDCLGWVSEGEGQFMARRRHLDALQRAHAALERGLQIYAHTHSLELLAEECRLAQEALSEITGAFRADDLLGAIFSTFCIGK